jgi:SulP family sulfate permease
MVTAAAGSVALVIGPAVRAFGVGYVLPIAVLSGLIQVAFGVLRLARVMNYVPRAVMTGFVNALGILIFLAQVPHVTRQSAPVYGLFTLTLAIVHFFPRLTKAVPPPLVAIVAVTILVSFEGLQVPNVGGLGSLRAGLPGLSELKVPLDWTTLRISFPVALSVAFVGLMESLLTAKLVDSLTGTPSDKNKESWALGVANLCAAFYGGISGCAMIGQTIVNVQMGRARTRWSTATAALVLLLLVTVLSPLLSLIPMVALAAVMMVVALKTIDFRGIRSAALGQAPLSETVAMAATVVATVWTKNLAIGVAAGVVLALASFARRVAKSVVVHRLSGGDAGKIRYEVSGLIFFGNAERLVERFHYAEDRPLVAIDFTGAQLFDASIRSALVEVESRYKQQGVSVAVFGLDGVAVAGAAPIVHSDSNTEPSF